MIDKMDRSILAVLQNDCTMPVAEIGRMVGLSTTPCWRRIQKLEAAGVIRARVALLDGGMLNVGVTVFVAVRTSRHDAEWLHDFAAAVSAIPFSVNGIRVRCFPSSAFFRSAFVVSARARATIS